MFKCNELVYVNVVENYVFFVGVVCLVIVVGVDRILINCVGLIYIIVCVVYGVVYIFIDYL